MLFFFKTWRGLEMLNWGKVNFTKVKFHLLFSPLSRNIISKLIFLSENNHFRASSCARISFALSSDKSYPHITQMASKVPAIGKKE